jgi:hypothetical protein
MLADVCRLCGRAFRYSRRKRRAMLEMLAENPVIFLTRKARSLAREFLSPIEHFIEYQDAPVSLPSGLAGIRAAGAPREFPWRGGKRREFAFRGICGRYPH